MPSVVNEFGAMPAAPDAFDLRLVDLGGGEAMVEVRTSGGAQRSGVDIEIVLDVSGSMATESEVQDAAGNVQRHGFSTLDVCKHAARCVACSSTTRAASGSSSTTRRRASSSASRA
ncbi:methyltransferase [Aureococcus anophagefferens]|nr:methyltransferase [Aureococcus anophagefferens]